MFDRRRIDAQRVLQRLHDSAVHQSGGAVRGGLGATAPAISTLVASQNQVDGAGNTVEAFIFGVDDPFTARVFTAQGAPIFNYGN